MSYHQSRPIYLDEELAYEVQVQNFAGTWATAGFKATDRFLAEMKKRHLERTNPLDRFRVAHLV